VELSVNKAQPSQRRTALIFAGLAILIGSAIGFAVTGLKDPFYILLGAGGVAVVVATVASTEFGLLLFVFITYTRFSDLAIDLYNAPSVAKFFVGAFTAQKQPLNGHLDGGVPHSSQFRRGGVSQRYGRFAELTDRHLLVRCKRASAIDNSESENKIQ
jgi:hypothetical protein